MTSQRHEQLNVSLNIQFDQLLIVSARSHAEVCLSV